MRNFIKKILMEEVEMKEMGVSINKIRTNQPKNYLIKSLKKKEANQELVGEYKKMTAKCNKLFSQISSELENIKWQDIKLSEFDNFFYVNFPTKITKKMGELTKIYDELNVASYTHGLSNEIKIYQMGEDYKEFIEKDYIYMYIDLPRNRTHFPKGLPKSFLGYNLGVKIYRKLLNTIGFMQTEDNATPAVQDVYRTLLQLPDVNSIIYKDSVLLIEDGLPKDKVMEIVSDSIYERYLLKPNMKKLVLNRSIIVNSKLLKIVGEANLLDMMYELYYTARKIKREPFKDLGYQF